MCRRADAWPPPARVGSSRRPGGCVTVTAVPRGFSLAGPPVFSRPGPASSRPLVDASPRSKLLGPENGPNGATRHGVGAARAGTDGPRREAANYPSGFLSPGQASAPTRCWARLVSGSVGTVSGHHTQPGRALLVCTFGPATLTIPSVAPVHPTSLEP